MFYIKEEIKRLESANEIAPLNARGLAKLKEFKHLLSLAETEVKKLNIPVVVGQSEQLNAFVEWWHGLSQEELAWYEGRYVEVFLSI